MFLAPSAAVEINLAYHVSQSTEERNLLTILFAGVGDMEWSWDAM